MREFVINPSTSYMAVTETEKHRPRGNMPDDFIPAKVRQPIIYTDAFFERLSQYIQSKTSRSVNSANAVLPMNCRYSRVSRFF